MQRFYWKINYLCQKQSVMDYKDIEIKKLSIRLHRLILLTAVACCMNGISIIIMNIDKLKVLTEALKKIL